MMSSFPKLSLLRLSALLPIALMVMLFGCKDDDKKKQQQESEANEEFPRSQTLYVGGFDWAQPSSFNPLAGDPNWPLDGNVKLVYAALFAFHQ